MTCQLNRVLVKRSNGELRGIKRWVIAFLFTAGAPALREEGGAAPGLRGARALPARPGEWRPRGQLGPWARPGRPLGSAALPVPVQSLSRAGDRQGQPRTATRRPGRVSPVRRYRVCLGCCGGRALSQQLEPRL